MTVRQVPRPALVLGSGQADAVVDAAAATAAGVEVARRRSGGGAVLVVPGTTVWFDVTVPAGDALWDRDVRRSFHWLGQAWVAALARLGVNADCHRAALVETSWSRLVCFAGLGPGEVTVGGRKAVGLSQRRTRDGCLFQCLATLRFDAPTLLDLLVLDDGERRAAAVDIAGRVAELGLGDDRFEDRLVESALSEITAR